MGASPASIDRAGSLRLARDDERARGVSGQVGDLRRARRAQLRRHVGGPRARDRVRHDPTTERVSGLFGWARSSSRASRSCRTARRSSARSISPCRRACRRFPVGDRRDVVGADRARRAPPDDRHPRRPDARRRRRLASSPTGAPRSTRRSPSFAAATTKSDRVDGQRRVRFRGNSSGCSACPDVRFTQGSRLMGGTDVPERLPRPLSPDLSLCLSLPRCPEP